MHQLSSHFSSGSIEVIERQSQGYRLNLVADNQSSIRQWFHFKINNALAQSLSFSIENIADSAYQDGWKEYRVCCSYDGVEWFRVDSEVIDNQLRFSLLFEQDSAFFAYFAPYSYERHMQLVHSAAQHPSVSHQVLGQTLDGREMNLLVAGNQDSEHKIWIIARQHPGETMAEWFMEGLIQRLLDEHDSVSRRLLAQCCFYLVPNMNPDGGERGHLRTNAQGINLNREWHRPSMEKSPEVMLVRQKMLETGMQLFVDVHGDEGLPYNFFAFSEGIPNYSATIAHQEQAFLQAYIQASPEFQDQFGYPKDEPGKADLSIASNWVGEQFKCLAATLEMPFKDNANLPDEHKGWSPERSMLLGEALLTPIFHHFNA